MDNLKKDINEMAKLLKVLPSKCIKEIEKEVHSIKNSYTVNSFPNKK